MNDGVNGIKTSANHKTGLMTVVAVKDGKDIGTTEIETKNAARLAVMLLMTAKAAFDASGRQFETKDAGERLHTFILQPSTVGVGSSPIQGCDALIFQFGETAISIAIPRSSLVDLGKQMLALGGSLIGPAH